MKLIGLLMLIIGISLFLFISYKFFTERTTIISPIPEEKGVRVIIITPTK